MRFTRHLTPRRTGKIFACMLATACSDSPLGLLRPGSYVVTEIPNTTFNTVVWGLNNRNEVELIDYSPKTLRVWRLGDAARTVTGCVNSTQLTSNGEMVCTVGSGSDLTLAVWRDGALTPVKNFPEKITGCVSFDMNASGAIAYSAGTPVGTFDCNFASARAGIWTPGGTKPLTPPGAFSWLYGFNDSGNIVLASGPGSKAALYRSDASGATWTTLSYTSNAGYASLGRGDITVGNTGGVGFWQRFDGTSGSVLAGSLWGVNNNGLYVGRLSSEGGGIFLGYVGKDAVIKLSSLVPDAAWLIDNPKAINDNGAIVAQGTRVSDGHQAMVLVHPR